MSDPDTDPIHATLREYFGFDSFRNGQYDVIKHLLNGHSAAAIFPTGGGKSLCYQLPALLLPGITLVVSPLIALMKDQIDALSTRGIAAQRLDSTLDAGTHRQTIDQACEGKLRLLYVAPERFNNERFRETLQTLRISLFAVDEAHCISEWGHNFRPDYLKLAGFARSFRAERILALTATATEQVLNDIRRGFDIAEENAVRTGFYRPNLMLLTTPVSEAEKDQVLLENLQKQPAGATIIYVTLQKTAEILADYLQSKGFQCKAYHAGMKDEYRSQVQDWFMASDQGIVVATIAFGMGVDKANIRYVYHYNLPKSLENYAQEIGRAGRDDHPSVCTILACSDDLTVLENFVYGDTPDSSAVQQLITHLFSLETQFDISLYSFSSTFDIRPLVLRTLLTYLELEGYLEGGTPFYETYSFKPLMSSAEILSQFHGERKTFLGNVFRQAKKAKVWFNIDPSRAATTLNTNRERIIHALDWLSQKQMLEIKVAGVRHRYRQLKTPNDKQALANHLFQRMLDRETAEIHRLQQLVDLIGSNSCQTAMLAAHFSEILEQPCGHCSWCLTGKVTLSKRISHSIPVDIQSKIQSIVVNSETDNIIEIPRVLARFLCGITSPGLSRSKLTRHPLFGIMVQIPFKEVLEWAENL